MLGGTGREKAVLRALAFEPLFLVWFYCKLFVLIKKKYIPQFLGANLLLTKWWTDLSLRPRL